MSRKVFNAERAYSVSTWLVAAAEDPAAAWDQWDRSGIAALGCGRTFGAARVPGDLVHMAARSRDPEEIATYLDEAVVGGAVFADVRLGEYYFLVPPGACLRWNLPGTKYLGEGWTIGVPRPGLPDDGRARRVWALEMSGPGALCVPAAVMRLVADGQVRRTSAESAAEAHRG